MTMHTRKADPDLIRAMAAEGRSQSFIADLLGVSRERIRQICARDGIETLNGRRDYDLSDRMRDCAARGLTIQEAAKELGRYSSAIYQKAKAEGIVFAEPKFRWHEVRDAAAEGLTATECARRMGWTPQNVWVEAKRNNITFQTHKAKRQSAVKGVSWHERLSRWQAYIRRNGKQVGLGTFINEADAIAARKAAEGEQ